MQNPLEPSLTNLISPARLAANRANASKSTGPRTPAGKARSASNSLQHGLYSLNQFEGFINDNNLALTIADNFLAEHQPVTPSEHALVYQLIHYQLRFLQMEDLYKQAVSAGFDSCKHLPLILRELDRLPSRMLRTLKALRQEEASRDENTEIEAIPDLPSLPEELAQSSESNPLEDPETRQKNAIKTGNRIFKMLIDRINEQYPPRSEADSPQNRPAAPNPEIMQVGPHDS